MAKSGYSCWIGLGGPCSSQVDKTDAGRPKYGGPGAQTTKAVETYLADKHRTLYTCRTRTCHVTLGLAAYIRRTREAFRAYYDPEINPSTHCNLYIGDLPYSAL